MSQSAALLPPTAAAPQLTLLGGFELSCCTRPVALSRSAQRLLAFLAVHRARPVRRTVLAERLWCDADPAHASSSLRSALWRLPRLHGQPVVASTSAHLRLAPHVGVDLWASEDRARAVTGTGPVPAEADASAGPWQALGLDLLPDWYDDWLLVEQESYRQVRLHALETLSSALRAAGRFPAALEAALSAVRSEPLRESAHRRVIEVHLAEGNLAEALRQYQVYRRLLADELGLPPSVTIRRLVGPLLGRPVDAGEG